MRKCARLASANTPVSICGWQLPAQPSAEGSGRASLRKRCACRSQAPAIEQEVRSYKICGWHLALVCWHLVHCAHLVWRKLVWVCISDTAGHKVDPLAGVCGGDSRQGGAVGIEDDQVPPRDEGDHVGQMVAAVEAHPKTACSDSERWHAAPLPSAQSRSKTGTPSTPKRPAATVSGGMQHHCLPHSHAARQGRLCMCDMCPLPELIVQGDAIGRLVLLYCLLPLEHR